MLIHVDGGPKSTPQDAAVPHRPVLQLVCTCPRNVGHLHRPLSTGDAQVSPGGAGNSAGLQARMSYTVRTGHSRRMRPGPGRAMDANPCRRQANTCPLGDRLLRPSILHAVPMDPGQSDGVSGEGEGGETEGTIQ